MVVSKASIRYYVFLVLFGIGIASHIDDMNGELSNFSFDRVVFRL